MSRLATLLCALALTGGLVMGLSGCGSDSSSADSGTTVATTGTSQSASNAAFCSSLVDVQSSVTDIKNTDPSDISIAKLTTLASGLGTALTQLTAGAKDAVGIDTTALQDSFTQLKDDLLAIPGNGQGLQAGLESAQKALVPVQDALNDVRPNCPG